MTILTYVDDNVKQWTLFTIIFINNVYDIIIMQPISCIIFQIMGNFSNNPLFFNELFEILPLFP